MSFIHSHYEKIALVAGGLVLIACCYFGFSGLTKAEQFVASNQGGPPKSTPGDVLKESVQSALNLISQDNEFKPKSDMQNPEKQVYIFKSVNLYGKFGDTTPFDPESPDADNVHEGIPNTYWFENNIEELMVYENATELDPDGDGFSIEEEFKAGTDPKDENSFPSLLSKVGADYVIEETIRFRFSPVGVGKIFPRLDILESKIKINELNELIEGESFPRKNPRGREIGDLIERFKFISLEKRKAQNGGAMVDCAVFKDRITEREIVVFKRGSLFKDRRVFLFLDAIGKGEEKAVGVRPGQKFSLPFAGEPKAFVVEEIVENPARDKEFIVKLSGSNGEKHEIVAKAR